MTIAVAGCVAQAEGEEIMRRAPAVDLVVGPQAYHRLPELIARAHRAGGARVAADSPPRKVRRPAGAERHAAAAASPPSSPSRKAATSSAPSASCPTPAAPSARGRPTRSWPRPAALAAPGRARGHAARPERQRLSRRGPGRRPWSLARLLAGLPRSTGLEPHPLHHQPPARHGRRPDRRPRDDAEADALSASAGAVGLGPHAGGDEPRPHAPTTICA